MTDSRSSGRSGPIAGPGAGRHLLVVDDDDRIRDLLKEFLAREGYRVTGAAHAAAARRLVELIEFDLIVLDVMMPGESGFDLTSWIRSQAETSKTPVMLLTAKGDPDDRIEGLSRGADDYMSKPFDPRELALRVDAILRRTGGKPLTPREIKLVVDDGFDFAVARRFEEVASSGTRLSLSPEFGNMQRSVQLIEQFIRSNPRWRVSLQTHKWIGVR